MSYWGSMFTSIAEAAKALSISERHLYRLIRENRVPFYNLSPRTTRVDLNELRDYMRLITRGPRADGREGFPRSHPIERINPGSLMITKLVYKDRQRMFGFDYLGPPWAFIVFAFVLAFVLLRLLS